MNATVQCGIILHPAGHTLSPVLHRTAYRDLGLDAHFEAHDVTATDLGDAIARMRREGWRQLAVSLPHKEAVLGFADRVTPAARAIGAANTLTLRDGLLEADNTDWIGVTRTLERSDRDWRGRQALVLGAGGAARAVIHALVALGMEVAVHNRSRERAERVAAELGARGAEDDLTWDLLVNTTPVGMAPDVDSTPIPARELRAGATVFATVYRPLETRLLREARASGADALDGLWMLVYQAVEQLRLWSGRAADPERLRRAALDAA